jgi:hypothetical protein
MVADELAHVKVADELVQLQIASELPSAVATSGQVVVPPMSQMGRIAGREELHAKLAPSPPGPRNTTATAVTRDGIEGEKEQLFLRG